MSDRTIRDLQQMQCLPLNVKILMTQQRIRDWVNAYGVDGTAVSFSGGKDSTVLLTIARQMYQDVLLYIKQHGIPIASVYGEVVVDYDASGQVDGQMRFQDLGGDWELFDTERPLLKTTGCERTGCMFCGFGCHLEKPGDGRFERMKVTHPKLYDYIMRPWEQEVEMIDGETGEKIVKKVTGLNYKAVIDWLNKEGNLDIRY